MCITVDYESEKGVQEKYLPEFQEHNIHSKHDKSSLSWQYPG